MERLCNRRQGRWMRAQIKGCTVLEEERKNLPLSCFQDRMKTEWNLLNKSDKRGTSSELRLDPHYMTGAQAQHPSSHLAFLRHTSQTVDQSISQRCGHLHSYSAGFFFFLPEQKTQHKPSRLTSPSSCWRSASPRS